MERKDIVIIAVPLSFGYLIQTRASYCYHAMESTPLLINSLFRVLGMILYARGRTDWQAIITIIILFADRVQGSRKLALKKYVFDRIHNTLQLILLPPNSPGL